MIDWPDLEARNAPLNAFVDFDRGATGGNGPLAGLTIGIKSNIAVRGLPWTAGMATRRAIIAERDAAVVARLRAAGATILGSLNMHEAALGSTTRNPHYGDTINPHRAGHTPGGSSGGSGAAVAAGLCDAALGTDTLGSIRIPAAYCGVYGLKPTHGAVDDDGLVALFRAFDSIGPLARDLDTLGKVWAVIKSSLVPSDVAGDERIFVLRDLSGVAIEGGVRTGYQRALAALRAPTEIALADTPIAIRTAAFASIGRQLAVDLGAGRDAPGLSDELTFMMRAAEAMPLRPDVLARTRATLREALGEDGVLVMPTAPQAAFPHTPRPPAGQADFTGLANVAGLPALAVPAGRDESGLPVGVQLVGPANAEGRLIALARTLEPALGGGVPPQGD